MIVGAGGLVGRHAFAVLRSNNARATYRVPLEKSDIALDVTDHEQVEATLERYRPAAIVLAAAKGSAEACEREPEATRRVNVEAARPFAAWAAAHGAALAVFSSEYVFDGLRGGYDENDDTDPINEYGRQKVELERIARTVPRHIVARTSGVFGIEPARKNFVCQLVDQLSAGKRFPVPSDQLITPTDARSLAQAIAALVRRSAWGTFHVVGPRILTRLEFARMVTEAFALSSDLLDPRSTEELGLYAQRPRRAGLRDTKLRATLGRGLEPPERALLRMARAFS